jgi:glycosyltransferase involved in cell wall biosynthesis
VKIIVSHLGKQHVNALLTGLSERHVLTQFYTSIAGNKIKVPQYLGKKISKMLQKRYFSNINEDKIKHFPVLGILMNFIKPEYLSVKFPYKWYDKWVAKLLNNIDFDMLIGYENATLYSFKSAKLRGKTTILDLAGVHHNYQNPVLTDAGVYKNQDELLYISKKKNEALAFTDYIITLSSFAEKTVIDSGFPADRIYKTYLGINQTVFTPKQHYNLEQNEQNTEGGNFPLSTTENKKKCLELYFVGTLSYRKGLPFMMQLLNVLIERKLNVRLTLIGPVDDFPIPELNAPYFRYFPFLNHAELVKMHHDLDLFIFPSNIDSWAQVVIEAMACGSPVLVSENTGAKDAVAQGGGAVLPVGDMQAWVNAIEIYYENRLFLKKTGEKASIIARKYTWEAYHQQIFKVMQDIFLRQKTKDSTGNSSLEKTIKTNV